MRNRFRVTGAAAVLALAFASGGCDIVVSGVEQQTWREDRRFTVSGRPSLELQTFDGSIDVRSGSGSEVVVTIERHAATEDAAKALEVTSEQNGNRISVRAKPPGHVFGWGRSRSVSLTVVVPPNADIEARSGDGSIRVEGVSGALKSHTGDGSIKLNAVSGPVDVSSGDGSIAIAGRMSQVRARSGDGSVTVEAQTGSTAADEWDVTTGDGSVTLRLPSDFNADIDAHTGDGGIRVQDLTLSSVSGDTGKNDLRGRLGSGGRTVRIRTGDGSITLKR